MDGMVAEAPEGRVLIENLPACMHEAVMAVEAYSEAAKRAAAGQLTRNGKPDRKALDQHQHMAHGLAWVCTYLETCARQPPGPPASMRRARLARSSSLLAQILFSRYLADLVGGIAMNQGETIRPHELGTLMRLTRFSKCLPSGAHHRWPDTGEHGCRWQRTAGRAWPRHG